MGTTGKSCEVSFVIVVIFIAVRIMSIIIMYMIMGTIIIIIMFNYIILKYVTNLTKNQNK